MNLFHNKPVITSPVERIQVIIEELSKVELELPLKLKTPENLRGIQSARGILRGLTFRL